MKKDSIPYVLGFMLTISVVFGAAVSVVHHGTTDILARNEQMHRNRTIANAFALDVAGDDAGALEQAISQHIQESTLSTDERTWTLFRRTSTEPPGQSAPIGFIFQGQGFWDVIRGIIVLSADLGTVENLRFLEQHETPGLGARIEEEWFLEEFQGLDIAWDAPADGRIIIGQVLDPDAANQVDAITGATQTSQALMRMLNQELHAFRTAYENHGRNGNTGG
jgi:Na+-transporting NADH:ubiquinone oxidoreductase subunit C